MREVGKVKKAGLIAAGMMAFSVTVLPGIAMANDKDHDGKARYDIARDLHDVRADTRDIRHDRMHAYRDERRKDRIQADLRYDLQHPLANRADIRRDIRRLDRVQYDLNRDRHDVYRDRVDRRRDIRDFHNDLVP